MQPAFDESALASAPRGAPLLVSVVVVVGAGVASWAVVLTGLYYAWTAIRSLLS